MDLWQQLGELKKSFEIYANNLEEIEREICKDLANNLDRADSWLDLQGSPLRTDWQWFIERLKEFIRKQRSYQKMEESQRQSEAKCPLAK